MGPTVYVVLLAMFSPGEFRLTHRDALRSSGVLLFLSFFIFFVIFQLTLFNAIESDLILLLK